MGGSDPAERSAQPDHLSRPPRFGEFQGDQGLSDRPADARREAAGQRGPDRVESDEKGSEVVHRSQDRIASADVHEAARSSNHPAQEEEGRVQILDEEVQPG